MMRPLRVLLDRLGYLDLGRAWVEDVSNATLSPNLYLSCLRCVQGPYSLD